MKSLTPDPTFAYFMLFLTFVSIIALIVALIKLIRANHKDTSTKLVWAFIILFVWLVGPLLYITMGGREVNG